MKKTKLIIEKAFVDLQNSIEKIPNLTADAKKKLDNGLENAKKDAVKEATPTTIDNRIYIGAIIVLGIVLISVTIGALLLSLRGLEIPEIIIALGSASVGAIAGLLSNPGK
ncbi:MAG: hypothetical protein PHQ09_04735 [Actinomycetota bacterium]|nr:hypothetical protein [Actinomycetota bacterium]